MSRPEADILVNPEGQRLLSYVTEGFYDNSYLALWLFQVMGIELDEMRGWTEEIKKEAFPQTATHSLPWWEFAYGIETDESLSLDVRRRHILSKKIEAVPLNPERIRIIVETLTGVSAKIVENVAPYTFAVMLNSKTTYVDAKTLWRQLKTIKPSHLSMKFIVEVEDSLSRQCHTNVSTLMQKFTIEAPPPVLPEMVGKQCHTNVLGIKQNIIMRAILESPNLKGEQYHASYVSVASKREIELPTQFPSLPEMQGKQCRTNTLGFKQNIVMRAAPVSRNFTGYQYHVGVASVARERNIHLLAPLPKLPDMQGKQCRTNILSFCQELIYDVLPTQLDSQGKQCRISAFTIRQNLNFNPSIKTIVAAIQYRATIITLQIGGIKFGI